MPLTIETIEEQNAIALSLLNHILEDNPTKEFLLKFGQNLAKKILQPLLLNKLSQVEAINKLDTETRKAVSCLVIHHSFNGRQYDGLRNKYLVEDVMTYEGALALLNEMNQILTDRASLISIKTLARFFKCMYDISAIFVQEFSSYHNELFKELISIIMPTAAEYSSRISFEELNNKKFARTFGLFAYPNDLLDEACMSQQTSVAEARITGKSSFVEISTQHRYRSVFIEYLKLKEAFDNLEANSVEKNHIESLLLAQIQKMINLDISLEFTKNDINKVDELACLNETWIEKLAKQTNAPLVAGVSGSMGRLLIVLIYFNAIQASDNSIDELQKLSNCVAAHMNFQGHHSIMEVHEAARRAIDALHIINAIKTKEFYTKSCFYRVGGIETFFHADFLPAIEKAYDYISLANNMPTQYSGVKL